MSKVLSYVIFWEDYYKPSATKVQKEREGKLLREDNKIILDAKIVFSSSWRFWIFIKPFLLQYLLHPLVLWRHREILQAWKEAKALPPYKNGQGTSLRVRFQKFCAVVMKTLPPE